MVEAPLPDGGNTGSGWEHLPLVVVWGLAAASVTFAPWLSVGGRIWPMPAVGALVALAMALAGIYRFRLWSPPAFLLAAGVAFGLLTASELAFEHSSLVLKLKTVSLMLAVAPAASGGAAGHLCGQWMSALLRAREFRGTGFVPKLVGAIGGAVLGLVAIDAADRHFVAESVMGGFATAGIVWYMTSVWVSALGVVVVLGHLDRIRRARQTRDE